MIPIIDNRPASWPAANGYCNAPTTAHLASTSTPHRAICGGMWRPLLALTTNQSKVTCPRCARRIARQG